MPPHPLLLLLVLALLLAASPLCPPASAQRLQQPFNQPQPRQPQQLLQLQLPGLEAATPVSDADTCLVVGTHGHGLGSVLSVLLNFLTLVPPRLRGHVYFDSSASSYSCSVPRSPGDWTHLMRPSAALRPWNHTAGCPCRSLSFADTLRALHCRKVAVAGLLGVGDPAAVEGAWQLPAGSPSLLQRWRRLTADHQRQLCDVVRRVWAPAEAVADALALELQRLEAAPRPLVVVHVRGGDKVRGGFREVPGGYRYNYTHGLRLLRDRMAAAGAPRAGSCLLLGDDHALAAGVEREAAAVLGCAATINRVPPGGAFDIKAFWGAGPRARCSEARRMLVDVELLARADWALGTVLSNVDNLAFHLHACHHDGSSGDAGSSGPGVAGGGFVDLNGWGPETLMPRMVSYDQDLWGKCRAALWWGKQMAAAVVAGLPCAGLSCSSTSALAQPDGPGGVAWARPAVAMAQGAPNQ